MKPWTTKFPTWLNCDPGRDLIPQVTNDTQGSAQYQCPITNLKKPKKQKQDENR